MNHFPNQNQNLAALLQSFTAASATTTPTPTSTNTNTNHSTPAAATNITSLSAPPHAQASTPTPAPGGAQAVPNPSTITTWPAALKHVVKIASVNEELQAKIKRMIQTKHDHERKWWEGRKALLAQQQSRAAKKRELEDVLKSVGAPVAPGGEISSSEDDAKELQAYDRKIYTAYTTLRKVQHSELRAAGIPFFAIDPALIHSEAHAQKGDDAVTSSRVSETDLKSLQHRMTGLLEDLCKE